MWFFLSYFIKFTFYERASAIATSIRSKKAAMSISYKKRNISWPVVAIRKTRRKNESYHTSNKQRKC
jgi:hypothetical protein